MGEPILSIAIPENVARFGARFTIGRIGGDRSSSMRVCRAW